jgi:hypothetical protein
VKDRVGDTRTKNLFTTKDMVIKIMAIEKEKLVMAIMKEIVATEMLAVVKKNLVMETKMEAMVTVVTKAGGDK